MPDPAKLLRLHFSEHDQYRGRPLYEAIVDECRRLRIAGATVLRGLEGYGETAGIHRPGVIRHDQPIIVTIVDSEENLQRLIPVIEPMLDTAVMAISDVEIIRIR